MPALLASKTDDEGNYSFTGLPCDVTLTLFADFLDERDRDNQSKSLGGSLVAKLFGKYLGRFYLAPNETRPRAVHRLEKAETKRSQEPGNAPRRTARHGRIGDAPTTGAASGRSADTRSDWAGA
ncbi:MAG: hypothetical protein ABFD16_18410 [Thermoguttaceae bacterium]